jgi:hypothetical protein
VDIELYNDEPNTKPADDIPILILSLQLVLTEDTLTPGRCRPPTPDFKRPSREATATPIDKETET